MRERITAYVYDQVVPFLTTFILAAVEENKDSESAAARCGLTAVVDSILAGLEEADTEFSKQAAAVVKRIPQEEVVKALKVDESDKDAHPRLVVFHVVTQVRTTIYIHYMSFLAFFRILKLKETVLATEPPGKP